MRKTAAVVAFILISLLAAAQTTIQDCIRDARNNYPEIAKFQLINRSKEYNLFNASRNWIPQVTIGAQATYQSEALSFPSGLVPGLELSGLALDQYKLTVDVSQVIWDGGASAAAKKSAEAEANRETAETEIHFHALEERVIEIYFGILMLQESYESILAQDAILEANLKRLESLYRNGVVQESDLNEIKVARLTLGQTLDQNRASYDCYKKLLEKLTGKEIGTLEMPVEQHIISRENFSPELALIDAGLASIDAKKKLLSANLAPKFALVAQGLYGNPGYDVFKAMGTRSWNLNGLVGIRMVWDIGSAFSFKKDRNELNNAGAKLALDREIFLFNSNLKTDSQDSEILRLRKLIAGDNEIANLRKDIRRTAERQIEEGEVDTADLLKKISEETIAVNNCKLHELELLKREYELKHTLNR